MKITISLLLFTILAFSTAKAQVDPHFTQYYIYPHYLNPATPGVIEGDQRVSAVYRNQWAGITDPFVTVGVSADIATNKKVNIGGSVFNQSAGDGGYNYLTGNVSLAYTGLRFGQGGYQNIVLGLQAGFISRRIDPTKFKFGDQWNPITGYSASNISQDQLLIRQSTVFDAGAGAMYFDGTPNKKANMYFGVAVFHLNQPKDGFITETGTIPMRITAHGGVTIAVKDNITLIPNFLIMSQGTATEKVLGGYVEIAANEVTSFIVGANYRFNDAFSPFAGIRWNDATVGVSYDVNTSQLGKAAKGANSFELTLSYSSKNAAKENLDYVKCPRF